MQPLQWQEKALGLVIGKSVIGHFFQMRTRYGSNLVTLIDIGLRLQATIQREWMGKPFIESEQKDEVKAAKWYRKVAEQGHKKALKKIEF